MGSAINGYNMLTVIGTGSFGTCYKVIRKDTGEIFVWKAVNYGKMTEEKKKLLVSEVNLLSGLTHPNIVKYHDRIIHKPTTTIYIVMEWCAGGDLSTLINQCRKSDIKLDEKFIWRVLYQLSRALQRCHLLLPEGPVLHRDIKPANVFLDGNGNVKLGDFGLAYLLHDGQTSVSLSAVVGTPFYMSPEVIQDSLYSEKSDIWSLGCLIYELCALQPPFNSSNLQQLIRSVQNGRFNRIPSDYSDDLHKMISYMLTVEHRSRPNVETILHHPQVIMHMVQESLAAIEIKSSCSEDVENELGTMAREGSSSSLSFSPYKCLEEVAKLKDTLLLKIEHLKEWEAMLTMREVELKEKDKYIMKKEKQIAASECLVKEKVSQAEHYLRYCQSNFGGSSKYHKTDVLYNPTSDFSVYTDEGDTSFTPSTSTKLNPHVVERPARFSRTHSGKHVHFGTLPSTKIKCLTSNGNNIDKSSFKSISHLLIDGYGMDTRGDLNRLSSQIKSEKYLKIKSNKSRKSTVVTDESSRSGASASSCQSGQLHWDEERKRWIEQKRVQFFCSNKENQSAKPVSHHSGVSCQSKLNVAVMKANILSTRHYEVI
ncbi:Serine/threonine-protein kinase polo [Gryllus bimaculatus]|nr:Serine/threonine-protein kinase polo [Gryllus bimaculatus]